MRLVAISVGITRTLHINGQDVRTAYLKESVPGAVRIGTDGVAGNEVAMHTDAVYAIGRQHYAFWSERLGQPAGAWPCGFFGENLTIDGLDESQLRIGDLLQVGGDVRLIVAGPRIPCFKLAWRMRQTEAFITQFARSGRTGIYFAVAEEGYVQAGDEVRVIRNTKLATVSAVAEMIFGNVDVNVDTLEELLGAPAISQTVALGLRNRLHRTIDTLRSLQHRWQGRRRFRIEAIVEETATIRSFHLVAVDGQPLASYRAGQFLTIHLPLSADLEVCRSWSLSDFSERPDAYRISIKRELSGAGSTWMHEQARIGTELDVYAPTGNFILERGSVKPVVLIAAGVGITPMLAMAKAHIARGAGSPLLYLVYCARNRAECAFRSELDALSTQEAVRFLYVSSAPTDHEKPGIDYDVAGHLQFEHLTRFVADAHVMHGGKRIDLPWYDCEIYLCGPAGFQHSILQQMQARGFDPSRVRREAFTVAGSQSTVDIDTARVVVHRSGKTLLWSAQTNETLLELLEANGLKPASSCRMGVCETCRCTLIQGNVRHDPQLPAHLPADAVLLCCARPDSEAVHLGFAS